MLRASLFIRLRRKEGAKWSHKIILVEWPVLRLCLAPQRLFYIRHKDISLSTITVASGISRMMGTWAPLSLRLQLQQEPGSLVSPSLLWLPLPALPHGPRQQAQLPVLGQFVAGEPRLRPGCLRSTTPAGAWCTRVARGLHWCSPQRGLSPNLQHPLIRRGQECSPLRAPREFHALKFHELFITWITSAATCHP